LSEEKEAEKKRFESIEDIPGIGPATAEKLREMGFSTVESLATAAIRELVPAGVGEKQAAKIIAEARNSIALTFVHADELIKLRKNVLRLSTGSKAIDELLGGGLETQTITEFYGEYGVGKSILCHQLSVNVQLPPEKGGLGGNALYIDTEETFRPEWIVRIANHLGLDPDVTAKNIIYCEAYNSDHQMLLLEKSDRVIKDNNIRLIIMDSLTAHFRSEYLGREMLAERQQKLNSHMHRLVRLARAFNASAVVTNQVMAKPDAFFASVVEAAGGHVVAHTCLHPDTLVQLADGSITKIKSVHNPLKLTSVDLKENLQTATSGCTGVWKIELPEILHIRAGFDIRASPNHRFFSLRDIDIAEVHAKELHTGDYLAYSRKIDIEGTPQPLPNVAVKRFYKLTMRGSKLVKSKLRSSGMKREELAGILQLNKRTLRRILNQGFPAERKTFEKIAEVIRMENVLLKTCLPHYSNKWRPLRIPSYLEPDLAQVLGYVLGDGHIGKRSIRLREQRLGVLKVYKRFFEKIFGIKGTITPVPGKRCYNLAINSIEITGFFRHLVDNWKEIVPKSTRYCTASFIRGLTDAEGSVTEWVYIAQKDRLLLEILQLLMLRFGIKSTISQSKGSYLLRIAEGTSLANFRKEIGLTAPDKARKLAKAAARKSRVGGDPIPINRQILWDLANSVGITPSTLIKHREATSITRSSLAVLLERIKSSKGYRTVRPDVLERIRKLERLVNSPLGWEKIRSINCEKATTPVYDITASPHANFVANGLLVHNSHTRVFVRRASGGVRIARLISSPYLAEGERIFKITEDGVIDVSEEDEVKRRRKE